MNDYNLMQYLAIQRVQVDAHATYMAQTLGRDVSLKEAIQDWANSPEDHAERFRQSFDGRIEYIVETCRTTCGTADRCPGFKEGCVLSVDRIKILLGEKK
jgi:hypothetical protein